MIPYVFTIVVLAGAVGRARPPASIGVTYVKEYRHLNFDLFWGELAGSKLHGGAII
jgi:hypothetical protein